MSVGVGVRYHETPIFFDAEGTTLFGIVTRPSDADGRTGIVLLPGAGIPLNTSRNRVTVRLSRGLAELGYTALRMDYHGTGESEGDVDRFHLANPFVDDVSAGIDYLRDLGVERIVVVGLTCFGARTAIATAAEREDVVAVVAMAMPLRDFARGEGRSLKAPMSRGVGRNLIKAFQPRSIRGLFNRRNRKIYGNYVRAKIRMVAAQLSPLLPWTKKRSSGNDRISPGLMSSLERLVERRVPVLLVYGESEPYYREFVAAREDGLLSILANSGSLFRVETVPGEVHGLATLDVQNATTELLLEWAKSRRSDDAASDPGGPSESGA